MDTAHEQVKSMPTFAAESDADFVTIYRQTVAALSPRDRTALDHALRSVTTAFAVAKAPTHIGEPATYPDLPDLPAAHVAAIAESIEDLEAGRVRDDEEVLAELRARFGIVGKS